MGLLRTLTACAFVVTSSSAMAAPLNLTLARPDITSGFITSSYNATSDALTASGFALSLDFDGVSPPDYAISGGTFQLNAIINGSGVMSSGTLVIGGSIGALGAASPLLTLNLSSFGFSNSPVTQIFEFLGTPSGGSLASQFGSSVGVILNLGGGFNGSFASNFQNSGQGVADTARVPAPGAGVLAVAVGLAGRRRRR